MDWAALIVGTLSFLGILLTLIVNIEHSKKLNKIQQNNFNEEFSRDLITNSRKEWLKDFKQTLSTFLACLMNYDNIAWLEKTEDTILVAELLNKIKFGLNPTDTIDKQFIAIIELAYLEFDYLTHFDLSQEQRKQAENKLNNLIIRIQDFASCLFKTEWERIKHYAKAGEGSNFEYVNTFYSLYDNVKRSDLFD